MKWDAVDLSAAESHSMNNYSLIDSSRNDLWAGKLLLYLNCGWTIVMCSIIWSTKLNDKSHFYPFEFGKNALFLCSESLLDVRLRRNWTKSNFVSTWSFWWTNYYLFPFDYHVWRKLYLHIPCTRALVQRHRILPFLSDCRVNIGKTWPPSNFSPFFAHVRCGRNGEPLSTRLPHFSLAHDIRCHIHPRL